jgi:hypothetical protein
MIPPVRLRPLVPPLILLGVAAKLIQLAVTRDGVGPAEYLTLAAVIGVVLLGVFRLSRAAIRRA